jgi:gamma-glutamyltranspeptidase/glutathione hydrolase
VDAIIAMAGVLAVVRPHMNGVGGDAFGLFYDAGSGTVVALNGSGRAGALATPEFFASKGRRTVPGSGALTVTVPGAVAAWQDALERFGTRPLAELLAPAIDYARDGFPVSVRLEADIRTQSGSLSVAARTQYWPGGDPPAPGTLLRNPALARTLEAIAAGGKDAFYRGPIAQRLSDFLQAEGGHVTAADFAAHTSTWVEPLSSDYLGHRFYALPPNSQGVGQLQQMQMSNFFSLKEMGFNSSSYLHHVVEVVKLSQADLDRWVADPEHAQVPVAALLDRDYLRGRAGLVSAERAAQDVTSGIGPALSTDAGAGDDPNDLGDTVYLTAVDRFGNAVSWIQSLYSGFGSGLFEPETGVMLHNRGGLFVLTEGHPNRVAPGKRPYHTLSPLLALRDGRFAFTVGTPGGDGQTQSLLQVVNALLMFGMTPQEAVEAARFRVGNGLSLQLEDRVPASVIRELEGRGHVVRVTSGWTATFGGAQMIFRDPVSGTLFAAADPRREAYALAY